MEQVLLSLKDAIDVPCQSTQARESFRIDMADSVVALDLLPSFNVGLAPHSAYMLKA